MKPAARIEAAIELLSVIDTSDQAADRIVQDFFRKRRYAGSKDRAAITERLYDILRFRGALLDRLDAPAEARSLVLAHLCLREHATAADVASLFDGDNFAPAQLDDGEQRLCDTLCGSALEPREWLRGSYPRWLEALLAARFGDRLDREMEALNERASVDLRVNTLLADRDGVLARLARDDIEARPGNHGPHCVRLVGRAPITAHTLYRNGSLEVQDEGSQLAAALVDARPGQQVLDLCAGAGGKALALAAAMENKGQIYAVDSDRRRLGRLNPRLQRARVRNIQSRPITGEDDPWLLTQEGLMDRVLVDALCSGTGTWRRNPNAKWRLTPETLDRDIAKQRSLLDRAALLVRPGGRLIYVTCSFLDVENERQIASFVERFPNFDVVPGPELWAGVLGSPCPVAGPHIQLTPARHGTDAFFVAILERREEPQ